MGGERPITDLRQRHPGYDIWVIGSGPSAGFIEPSFFDNKIAIGVNETWIRFPNVDYLVRKEAARSAVAYETGIPLIVSRFDCGNRRGKVNRFQGPFDYFVFDHAQNGLDQIDLQAIGTDRITVSWSTITSAIHIAAYMGAANIVIVGHDCGLIDGQNRIAGYPPSLPGWDYNGWLKKIEPQTIALRERIWEVYRARIYSLNPWLNFGLEGHRYER